MIAKTKFIMLVAAALLAAICSSVAYAASCTSPAWPEGTRIWSSSTYQVCNGTSWISFLTGGTNGTCAVTASQMASLSTAPGQYEFCNGTNYEIVSCTGASLTWTSIVAGEYISCGITSDGNAWCWGYNGYGAVGDTTTTNRYVPTLVSTTGVTGTSWTSLYPMDSTEDGDYVGTCGVRSDGSAWCWGYNNNGSLGTGSTSTVYTPTLVSTTGTTGTSWSQVRESYFAGCGIRSDGTGYCWGSDQNGVGGCSGCAAQSTPHALTMTGVTGSNWTQIWSGSGAKCGLRDDGTIWCWGYASSIGNIGNGTMSGASAPTAVSTTGVTGTSWTFLSPSGYYTPCGIRSDGTAWCWGENGDDEIGNGGSTNEDVPTEVSTTGVSGTSWTYIGTGYLGTCGIRNDGTAWCWGTNTYDEIGSGTGTTSSVFSTPTAVSTTGVTGTSWTMINMGWGGACGLRNDGTAYCWGINTYGENGNGTTTAANAPVAVFVPCTTYGTCSTQYSMDYDFTNHRQIVCNGTNWVAIAQ